MIYNIPEERRMLIFMDAETESIISKTSYLSPDASCIRNAMITEWDLASAGLAAAEYKGLLPKDEIAKLRAMDKNSRVVAMGKAAISDPSLSKGVLDGIAEARRMLAEANGLTAERILSIKKDAVFVVGPDLKATEFAEGVFVFRPKNRYTSYLRMGPKPYEAYYSAITGRIDVKGIADEARDPQRDFLLKDLARLMGQAEKLGHDKMFAVACDYRGRYVRRELPKETYRQMSDGKFSFGAYESDDISDDDLRDIDIYENFNRMLIPFIASIV
jgi:hypothetical protein